LNSPFYTNGSRSYLLKLIEKVVYYLEVDALIISDINLLLQLFKNDFPVKLHLSSLGNCFNSHTVDFYYFLGINRIILPRQLRATEIYYIVHQKYDIMEFEVFAMNDGCYFEEGFCQTTHGFGPFCIMDYEMGFHKFKYFSHNYDINEHELINQQNNYTWFQNNCGSTFQEHGLPNGPCSFCLFGYLREWGIKSVKIAGREASFYRKCASIQLVKSVIDDVRNNVPPKTIAYNAKKIRNTPDYCNNGYMCYFRDPDFKYY
jgi:putative protease